MNYELIINSLRDRATNFNYEKEKDEVSLLQASAFMHGVRITNYKLRIGAIAQRLVEKRLDSGV